jgi:hypothetical protein
MLTTRHRPGCLRTHRAPRAADLPIASIATLRSGPPAHNPEAHKLYSNLAACYTKLGAYPEGIKAADRCIELAPTFAKGYSRKGTLQFLMKEYSKVGANGEGCRPLGCQRGACPARDRFAPQICVTIAPVRRLP